jgi:hypothetical protein
MKKLELIGTIGIGAIAASLTFIPQPAFAANVTGACAASSPVGTFLLNQGINETTFQNNCNTTQLGVVKGRSGKSGVHLNGDYEVLIDDTGLVGIPEDQMQLNWEDKVSYQWTLNWNPGTKTAQFQVTNPLNLVGLNNPIIAQFPVNSGDLFNAFGLVVRADNPASYITAGTTMTFNVNSITVQGTSSQITDNSLNLSVVATSGTQRFAKNFYTLNPSATGLNANSEILSMSGTFMMNAPDGKVPQDFVTNGALGIGFELKIIDPPLQPAPNDDTSVPEPSAILGLGILSLGAFFKRKLAKTQKQNHPSEAA